MTIVAHAKDGLYCDEYFENLFFLFAIKIFGCLQQ